MFFKVVGRCSRDAMGEGGVILGGGEEIPKIIVLVNFYNEKRNINDHLLSG